MEELLNKIVEEFEEYAATLEDDSKFYAAVERLRKQIKKEESK